MTVNLSLVVWVGCALMLAWVVGAYSRLSRLRDQMVRSKISLLKYAAMYKSLCNQFQVSTETSAQPSDAIRVDESAPMADLLLGLVSAVAALQQPMVDWTTNGYRRGSAKSLGNALDTIHSCIEALAAAPDDLAGTRWPLEERSLWTELAEDVRIRRSRYNVHALELKEAVEQMPAAVLARLAGIHAWGEV
jgi:hypothetical protein